MALRRPIILLKIVAVTGWFHSNRPALLAGY
jgi:hypothetical protein